MHSLMAMRIPWRTIQVCINIGTIVSGFCTFLPQGYLTRYFLQQCVLYADVRVATANATSITLDITHSVFSDSSNCAFTTYSSVMAVIHAFIWCCFFLLMKSHMKSENREFSLLLPSFLLHIVMFVVAFISSNIISVGSDTFCRNLVRELDRFSTDIGKRFTCQDTENLDWSIFGEKHRFHTFFLVAKISSWTMTITVLAQSVVCGYKLYAWFIGATDGFSVKERLKSGHRKVSVETFSYNGDVIPPEDMHTVVVTCDAQSEHSFTSISTTSVELNFKKDAEKQPLTVNAV